MRKINFVGQPPAPDPKSRMDFLDVCVRQIAQASQENDVNDIAGAFTITGAFTETRTLDVSTATLSDVIAVVATLLTDLKAGGQHRTV